MMMKLDVVPNDYRTFASLLSPRGTRDNLSRGTIPQNEEKEIYLTYIDIQIVWTVTVLACKIRTNCRSKNAETQS